MLTQRMSVDAAEISITVASKHQHWVKQVGLGIVGCRAAERFCKLLVQAASLSMLQCEYIR